MKDTLQVNGWNFYCVDILASWRLWSRKTLASVFHHVTIIDNWRPVTLWGRIAPSVEMLIVLLLIPSRERLLYDFTIALPINLSSCEIWARRWEHVKVVGWSLLLMNHSFDTGRGATDWQNGLSVFLLLGHKILNFLLWNFVVNGVKFDIIVEHFSLM